MIFAQAFNQTRSLLCKCTYVVIEENRNILLMFCFSKYCTIYVSLVLRWSLCFERAKMREATTTVLICAWACLNYFYSSLLTVFFECSTFFSSLGSDIPLSRKIVHRFLSTACTLHIEIGFQWLVNTADQESDLQMISSFTDPNLWTWCIR